MTAPPSSPPRPPRDNPLRGALYVLDGLHLLRVRGLRGYVAVPLAINAILFAAGLWWAWSRLGGVGRALEDWLPGWLDFLSVLLVPLFFVAALTFVFFFFALAANLVAAPFNGLLAEAVERHLRRERGERVPEAPLRWSAVVRDVAASLGSELRKLAYFAPRALGIGILYLIPPLSLAAPFVSLAFSAWMLAISYVDYPMANHGLGFREQRRALRRWRLTSLGFGALATIAVLVPLVNLVVMPAAVAGATKFWLERIAPHREGAPGGAGDAGRPPR